MVLKRLLSVTVCSFLLVTPLIAQQDRSAPVAAPAAQEPSRNAYGEQKSDTTTRTLPVPSENIRTRNAYARPEFSDSNLGSTYISVDSWIYSAMLRLHAMGYLDTAFLNMRPWTRLSALHMLQESEYKIDSDGNEQAMDILATVERSLEAEIPASKGMPRGPVFGIESAYLQVRANGGRVLRDSYHVGQTYINDYGRPYGEGFNTYDGVSALAEFGRFSLHVRGEVQHGPSFHGYSLAQNQALIGTDGYIYTGVSSTVPGVNPQAVNSFRLIDAAVSYHLLNHEISFGKTDTWMSPARGGALAFSNNAEDLYTFRINRVEPLHVPLLSRFLGPLRYDFFVGSLKGHTYPNSPWLHSEMFAFAPTANFQFGFQRTVIWGGKGHEPITLHSFLKSFISVNDTNAATKFSRNDPGARFSDFSFSWRLPYIQNWATLYADTFVHDDVTPVSAPRRSAFRTGVYLSHVPKVPKLDMRVEAVLTDPKVANSQSGGFLYIETVQRDGYTNKGFIMGDWIGREAKGGQAWLTYHFSPNESIELEYRNKKTAKDFIQFGTTQNTFAVTVIKRIRPDLELNASFSHEPWKAPFVTTGPQHTTTGSFQLTWYPRLRSGSLLP